MNRFTLPLATTLGAAMPFVFDSALKGALLLLLAALCALALRRSSAATRHLVWLIAVAALLLVPVLSAWLPQWRVLPQWASAPNATRLEAPQPALTPVAAPPLEGGLANDSDTGPAADVSPRSANAPTTSVASRAEPVAVLPAEAPKVDAEAPANFWRAWLLMLWAAGCGLCVLRLVAAYGLLRRTTKACTEIVDGPLFLALAEACRQLGVRQRVRLHVDPRRTIPLVWGVLRPHLVLPAEAATWDARQLRSVLLHELAHIRRRDTAVQWLTQIACAIHWFNPLVWLAAWRLHAERERACDDLVLASGVRPSDYAEHLLHVATKLQGAGWANACGLAMARPSRLEGRLLAVLSDRLNRRRVTAALAALALLLGACVAIPLAMLRAADEEQPWNPPQAAHIGTNAASVYCVHDGPQAAFILFYEGMFNSSSTGSNNAKTRVWTDSGEITFTGEATKYVFSRRSAVPDSLTLNGQALDLTKGRVLVLGLDGTVRHLAINPPAITDQEGVKNFAQKVKAMLASPPPQTEEARADAKDRLAQRDVLVARLKDTETKLGKARQRLDDMRAAGAAAENVEAVQGDVTRWQQQLKQQQAELDRAERRLGGAGILAGPISEPQSDEAKALLKAWEPMMRGGRIPGALIGELAVQVDSYPKQPGQNEAEKTKFAPIRPRMDARHDWAVADAVALLNEITAVAKAPVGWEELELKFAAADHLAGGKPLPPELAGAAWGQPSESGLRVAWLLEPRSESYAHGTVLKARVLFHNTGKEPVTFKTDEWHQFDADAGHDAQGQPISVLSTMYSGVTLTKEFRLSPGEYCEVPGHGIAIGAGKYEEEFSVGSVGAIVEAKVGDDVRLQWKVDMESDGWSRPDESKVPDEKRKAMFLRRVNLEGPWAAVVTRAEREEVLRRLVRDLLGVTPTPAEVEEFVTDARPDALTQLALRLLKKSPGVPFKGKLPTGEVKFRVTDVDPEAAKKPRLATGPGRYQLAKDVWLQVSRLTQDGKDTNQASIEFTESDPKASPKFSPHVIKLPEGPEAFALAWVRETRELWLATKDDFQKIEFRDPAAGVQEEHYDPWNRALAPEAIRDLLGKTMHLVPRLSGSLTITGTGPLNLKNVKRPTPEAPPKPEPATREPGVFVVTKPGRWDVPGGVTLEIPTPVEPAGPLQAILHWPARGQWPAVQHAVLLLAAPRALEAKWAVGWVVEKQELWIVAEEPGNASMLRQIVYGQPEKIFENLLGRREHEPIDGLNLPKMLSRELERHFVITHPAPGEIERPGGPQVGGQQQYAAKTEQAWIVEGTVADETGRPLADVAVEAHCEHYPLVVFDHARTDAAGHYRVALRLGLETLAAFRGVDVRPILRGFAERKFAESGEFSAVLSPGEKVEHPFAQRELLLGQPGHADFVMVRGCSIEGQLVDPEGHPLPRRFIAAEMPGQRLGYSLASTTADAEGRFRLEDLPPNVPIYLHTAAPEHPSQTGSSQPVTYRSGEISRVKVTVEKKDSGPETVTVIPIGN